VDVAIKTPACAPRVTDDVVLDSVVNTPADCDDSVIDCSWASISSGDDTAAVVPECVVTSSNGNVDWLLLETAQVLSFSSCASVRRHFSHALAFIISACSFSAGFTRSVGVVRFKHHLVGLEPVISPEVPAT